MNPLHEQLVRVGLAASAPFDFALAGGHALRAHGLSSRACDDIELLTPRVSGVTEALTGVVSAYESAGFAVTIDLAGGSFARLRVRESTDALTKVKLCVDQRAYPPALLEIGPVLSADDAVAGAMVALLGRHHAEDFVDVDLVLRSRHYTRGDLLQLARRHDPGFEVVYFCESLAALRFVSDLAFAPYGLTSVEVGALRDRFAGWQRELVVQWLSSW